MEQKPRNFAYYFDWIMVTDEAYKDVPVSQKAHTVFSLTKCVQKYPLFSMSSVDYIVI